MLFSLPCRIYCEDKHSFLQDCEDDGETAAGGRLLHLLQVIISSRKHLPPPNISHIQLRIQHFSARKKSKVSNEVSWCTTYKALVPNFIIETEFSLANGSNYLLASVCLIGVIFSLYNLASAVLIGSKELFTGTHKLLISVVG